MRYEIIYLLIRYGLILLLIAGMIWFLRGWL